MDEAVVWRRFSGHERKTYQADECTAVHTKVACDDGKENEILLKKYRFLISYCRKGTFPSIFAILGEIYAKGSTEKRAATEATAYKRRLKPSSAKEGTKQSSDGPPFGLALLN